MKQLITLFIANLEGGGAERVFVTLANGFFKKGFSVDLVLIKRSGPYISEVDDGVKIVSLNARKAIFALPPLIIYLRRRKPTIMLSTLSRVNTLAVLARIFSGVKTKLVLREAITVSFDNQFNKSIIAGALSYFEKWAFRNAEHIVAPSKGVAEDLILNLGIFKDKITVINNPIDINRWESLAEFTNLILQQIPQNLPIVLGMGRLNQQKDFETLIRAFAIVCKTKKVILLILGDGEERVKLENLIAELRLKGKVFMPGFVENPFIYLKRASVFVLSSKYEGLPNSLLQALALGTPVVATDCPSGPREILENGLYGRLVTIGNCDEMANGIHAGLSGLISVPDKEKIESKYGVDRIISEYLHVLIPK